MHFQENEHGEWVELASFRSSNEAEIEAAYLRSEGIEAVVTSHRGLPEDPGKSLLWVLNSSLERAKWFRMLPPVSEAELEYLATGELPSLRDSGDLPNA